MSDIDIKVGDVVSTQAQYAALPVGSQVVREQATYPTWKRVGGGRWLKAKKSPARGYRRYAYANELSGVKRRVVRVGPKPKKLKIALWLLAEKDWQLRRAHNDGNEARARAASARSIASRKTELSTPQEPTTRSVVLLKYVGGHESAAIRRDSCPLNARQDWQIAGVDGFSSWTEVIARSTSVEIIHRGGEQA